MTFRHSLLVAMLCFALFSLTVAEQTLADLTPAKDSRTARQTYQSPAMAEMNLPFSDAVLVGNTLYLSGKLGIDPATMSAPDDPKEETKLLMDSFEATLAMADMTLDDLVSVTIYCPDLSLYKDFNEVYSRYFADHFPARAFIGSGPLLFGARFEMQAIAVK